MPLEIPQLDDRSATEITQETVARIPIHTPEWNNFNDSDPGMTLVQLFAYMTENLLYRANRVPERNRLKFLQLLGINLRPPSAGRGIIVFDNERGPVERVPLDAGLTVRAGTVPFRTRINVDILPVSAAVFYKEPRTALEEDEIDALRVLYEPELDDELTELDYYQTAPLNPPEIGKPLPEVNISPTAADTLDGSLWMALLAPKNVSVDSVRAAIAETTLSIGVYPSLRVDGAHIEPEASEAKIVEESGLIFEIAAPDQELALEELPPPNYARLPVEYAEDVLNQPGIVRVTLPKYEAINLWDFDPNEEGTGDYPPLIEDAEIASRLVTWIRIRLPRTEDADSDSRQQKARLTWLGVNATRVIQAVPVENERIGVGNGAPNQVYKVANTPVITNIDEDEVSTFTLEIQQADKTWKAWEHTDDLYAASPDDAMYTLDPESGEVRFGDGLRGKRPPVNQAIRMSYEYGGGLAGKVAIDAINKTTLPGGFKVRNPLPTWGADSGETPEDGERNIPKVLRHRERLVTLDDYRDITLQTPGVEVARVEVLPLFNPDTFDPANPQNHPGAITVMVVPDYQGHPVEPPMPDRLFLDAVCDWLKDRRLATTEVFIRGPEYVKLWLSVGIVTMPGRLRARVKQATRDALLNYLSPLFGGLPDSETDIGSGWSLGMEIRKQDLEAVAVRVDGVRYVQDVKLGVSNNAGNFIQSTDKVQINGIELPWVANISVSEGAAGDLNDFTRSSDSNADKRLAVPTSSSKC